VKLLAIGKRNGEPGHSWLAVSLPYRDNTGMQVAIKYGQQQAILEVADENLSPTRAAKPLTSLPDPAAGIRSALEHPLDYPPLRRALTPDDPVAVLVDERLPQLPGLLVPILEHVLSVGITPESITLLCATPSTRQPWLDELPESLEEIHCEVHDPRDRRGLSFVTTMSGSRPLFFNRTAVDAAQLVVLTGRRFDTLTGHGGGVGFLFPSFCDAACRSDSIRRLTLEVPGPVPWRTQEDAQEVSWLLGAPFFVQVIEGAEDSIADILAGSSPSLPEGERRHEALWRRTLPCPVDVVVAALGGNPARHGLPDLADALACASRVLRPGGAIVLLSEASPVEDAAMGLLRDSDEPADVLREFERRKDLDLRAAWQWASVAQQARIFLLSGLPGEVVEEMFAMPLENIEQVQRLIGPCVSCAFLADAHKTLALVDPS
jgi:nickel-dependent lactate racemase